MLTLERGLSIVLFLPYFILRLLFRYTRLLAILTSGFATTLILVAAWVLAFTLLIYLIVILTTEELRMEWVSWVAQLLFGLVVLFFHYLAVWNEDSGSQFLDFFNWLNRVPSNLWNKQLILRLGSIK